MVMHGHNWLLIVIATISLLTQSTCSVLGSSPLPPGDFLQSMEWVRGSDDVSVQDLYRPDFFTPASVKIDKGAPPLGSTPSEKAASEIAANSFPSTKLTPLQMEAEQLGATLVRAYSAVNDPTHNSKSPLLAEYDEYLSQNRAYLKEIRELFQQLDENGDNYIDDIELHKAFENGYLSAIGVRVVKTWDINYSKRISWQEFRLGPLFVIILEGHKPILDDFKNNVPGSSELATKLYRHVVGKYIESHPASVGFLELQSSTTSATKSKETTGISAKVAQERAHAREHRQAPGKAKDWRPKSKFGVPSLDDETCVMCQFIYQRMEYELKRKVVDDYTIFDQYPKGSEQTGGFPGIAQLSGRATGVRANDVRLIDDRGTRTPSRMIKQVSEIVMRTNCGDTAPFLFREGCQNIWLKRNELAFALYRKLPSGAACQTAQLCSGSSYLHQSYAVHSLTMSNKFNGGRGLCGMMGGPKSRGGAACPPQIGTAVDVFNYPELAKIMK